MYVKISGCSADQESLGSWYGVQKGGDGDLTKMRTVGTQGIPKLDES